MGIVALEAWGGISLGQAPGPGLTPRPCCDAEKSANLTPFVFFSPHERVSNGSLVV